MTQRAVADTPEAGNCMSKTPSNKLTQIIAMLQEGGIQLAVLSETHLTQTETDEILEYLRTEHGYDGYATPGSHNTSYVRRGVS